MSDNLSLNSFLGSLEERIRHELRTRCELFEPNFERPRVFIVLTGLLARQTTLALELSSAPQIWNAHSAPLFLRAMADLHITLSWILLDPEPRAQQYIEFGLGQAVLDMKHIEAEIEQQKTEQRDTLREMQSWIDVQRLSFLVEVNVGAWSGGNTRQMADQAALLDFYNSVYTPMSACVHSSWYHVGKLNSGLSDSPLTRLLRVPRIAEAETDLWNLLLAVKCLDKSFNVFDEKALGRPAMSSIHDWIYDMLTPDEEDTSKQGE